MAKRYLVFYGTKGKRAGGWNDYFTSFDNVPEAKERLENIRRHYPKEIDWYQIIDIQEGEFHYIEEYTYGD